MQNCCRMIGDFQVSDQRNQKLQEPHYRVPVNMQHWWASVEVTFFTGPSHFSIVWGWLNTPGRTQGEILPIAQDAPLCWLLISGECAISAVVRYWPPSHPCTPTLQSKGAEREEIVNFCQRMLLRAEVQEVERQARGVDLLLALFSLSLLPENVASVDVSMSIMMHH